MSARPDEELIAAYLAGDTGALAELMESHRRTLYGYIVNMIGAGADADDVFQTVWLSAIRYLHNYRHKNFGGWLVRIAHNSVIDRARKRKPDASLDAEDDSGRTMKESLAAGGFDPHREAAASELGQRIRDAVQTLSADQREVFLLRTQQNMSFKEIAKLQGVSINTALARMQYALAHLRPRLQDDYENLSDY